MNEVKFGEFVETNTCVTEIDMGTFIRCQFTKLRSPLTFIIIYLCVPYSSVHQPSSSVWALATPDWKSLQGLGGQAERGEILVCGQEFSALLPAGKWLEIQIPVLGKVRIWLSENSGSAQNQCLKNQCLKRTLKLSQYRNLYSHRVLVVMNFPVQGNYKWLLLFTCGRKL